MERARELEILIDALKRYYDDLGPSQANDRLPDVITDHTRKVRDEVASMIESYIQQQEYLEEKREGGGE